MPTDGFSVALLLLGVLIFGGVLGMLRLRVRVETGAAGRSVSVSLEVRSRWTRGAREDREAKARMSQAVEADGVCRCRRPAGN